MANVIEIYQRNYLQILYEIEQIIKTDKELKIVVDKLNKFISLNRKKINFYLNYYLEGSDVIVITGKASCTIEDSIPSFLVGNYHIFDDNLLNIVQLANEKIDLNYTEIILQKLQIYINNRIELIEKYDCNIILIPMRSIIESSSESSLLLNQYCEKQFLSLFQDTIDSLEEYKRKVVKIEDIKNYYIESQFRNILLFETDNPLNSIEERIQLLKNRNRDLYENKTDGEILFLTVFGYFRQAISIVQLFIHYNVIPSCDSFNIFYYTKLISESIENFNKQDIIDKMTINYFLNIIYSENERNLSFDEAKQINADKNFYELKVQGKSLNNLYYEIDTLIKSCFIDNKQVDC